MNKDFFNGCHVLNFNDNGLPVLKETSKTQNTNNLYLEDKNEPDTPKTVSKVVISEVIIANTTIETSSDADVICKKCGRILKGLESKSLGYGPTCYKKVQCDKVKQINLFMSKSKECTL